MKNAIPVLLLALAACQSMSDPSGSSTSPAGQLRQDGTAMQSDPSTTLKAIGSAGATASQVGLLMGNPVVAGAGAAVAALADVVNTATTPTLAPPQIDTSNQFVYEDVYFNTTDPDGMKALVPYFLQTDQWMLILYESITDTYLHYRFQKISSGVGRSLPFVDIFKPTNK